ncbi:MAG TPA: riboflavin synthase, partial [Gammaproteobacteria bacterium]|nr:riboflavin synthase [Gammaproteobacteria bacterium]
MFTGIIEAVGRIKNLQPMGGDLRLFVETGSLDMSDVQLGDSIAVNGVCLTAIEFNDTYFAADVSNETIKLTSLKDLAVGSEVNLEKALLPTTRLGGHLVSGHVDGLGEVQSITEESRSIRLSIRAP